MLFKRLAFLSLVHTIEKLYNTELWENTSGEELTQAIKVFQKLPII